MKGQVPENMALPKGCGIGCKRRVLAWNLFSGSGASCFQVVSLLADCLVRQCVFRDWGIRLAPNALLWLLDVKHRPCFVVPCRVCRGVGGRGCCRGGCNSVLGNCPCLSRWNGNWVRVSRFKEVCVFVQLNHFSLRRGRSPEGFGLRLGSWRMSFRPILQSDAPTRPRV